MKKPFQQIIGNVWRRLPECGIIQSFNKFFFRVDRISSRHPEKSVIDGIFERYELILASTRIENLCET